MTMTEDAPGGAEAAEPRLARAAVEEMQLAGEPWDAWPVYPDGEEPEFRVTQFGAHGLLSRPLPRPERRRPPGRFP